MCPPETNPVQIRYDHQTEELDPQRIRAQKQKLCDKLAAFCSLLRLRTVLQNSSEDVLKMLTLPLAHICVLCQLQRGKKEKRQLRPKRREQKKKTKNSIKLLYSVCQILQDDVRDVQTHFLIL